MINLVNSIISKIKKENYKLDSNITLAALLNLILERVIMLLRGYIKGVFIKRKSLVFLGRKVILKNKAYISLGKGVTIEDYAELDGLSREGIVIHDNVKIGAYTKIKCTGTIKNLGKGIKIGSNSGIGDFSFFGAAGGIEIGNNVIMGQNVRFHSENHNFDRLDIPIKEQGVTNKGIIVGDDCWIGSGVVFLDGVQVGEGCVIGANTLINKDIPPYSVAVGNPVKIVKNRLEMKERAN